MAITRRELLRRSGQLSALGLLPVLTRCGGTPAPEAGDGLPRYEYSGPAPSQPVFGQGVASGDPLADAVVLWTHIDVAPDAEVDEVEVFVEISEDPSFERRQSASSYAATRERDFTLKVDAVDLEPGRTYYYRFSALGETSEIGRTRTAPAGDSARLKFGVCACSNYAFGYFHAYRHLSQRQDIDAVLHLGDYIYEYASGRYGALRPCDPEHEILTLPDYRRRYRQYRSDPDLQAAHRAHPWITVWDDHEFANNPFIGGAENHQMLTEGSWTERVANAIRAYDEWMPTRVAAPDKIYRSFAFGSLATLHALDIKRPLVSPVPQEAPSMLGEEQASWLDQQLEDSPGRWVILAQQQTFATGRSAWDEHPESRRRIQRKVAEANIENVIVLTGDIHQGLAADITEVPNDGYDPNTGENTWGVEMVCSSITSPGGGSNLSDLPHKFWANGLVRGYLVLTLSPTRAQGDWYGFFDFAKAFTELPEEQWIKGFHTDAGRNHLVEASEPAD